MKKAYNMEMKTFLIIICILFPVMTEGADWVKIAETQNPKAMISVDAGSIQKVSSNLSMAWRKAEAINHESIKEVHSYSMLDCAERRHKRLQATVYNLDGSTDTGNVRDWQNVIPGSAMERVLDFVCTYKKGVLKISNREEN